MNYYQIKVSFFCRDLVIIKLQEDGKSGRTEQSGYQFKNTAAQPASNARKTPLHV
jgi:hypothetical protein